MKPAFWFIGDSSFNQASIEHKIKKKGPGVAAVLDAILKAKPIEQQAYRACRAVMALADKHGDKVLDEACTRALAISRVPTYKTVKTLVLRIVVTKEDAISAVNKFAYLRGAEYFENETGKEIENA